MNKMVECYIHDVTRRLSENERDEVKRELETSITDMLPDNPAEQDIINVLTRLGAPRLLAEQYRQNPRYLISPATFELYISTLKTVTAIVSTIFACIGALMATSSGSVNEIIEGAIEMAISGALQAAFWVTFGFVMSDKAKPKPWTVSDLPQMPNQKGVKIARSSSITGIILAIFFTIWFTMMIMRNEWLLVFVRGSEIIAPFSQTALNRLIPYIFLLGSLNILLNILKLFWARWTLPLCLANIINNIVWVTVIIYILHWPDLLNNEFSKYTNIIAKDYQHILPGGIPMFFSVLFIIIAIIDISTSVWHTWKGMRESH